MSPDAGIRSPAATVADAARRTLGLLLIALVLVPAYRMVAGGDPNAERMAASGAAYWRVTWAGLAIAGAIATVIAAFTAGRIRRLAGAAGRTLARPSRPVFAAGVALAGALATALVTFAVLDARTILNDASVQLLQARYFAAGRLSGPVLAMPEFWSVQFMVQTAAGWVSQYPPGHAAALAAGFLAGGPWVATIAAVGATGALLVLSFERLLPERRAVARLAALLAVLSPLLVVLAAGYMNHATLAAGAAAALYFALRAEEGSVLWAVAAGAAMGWMVTVRPVTGLLIGVVVTAVVWISAERARPASGDPDRRGGHRAAPDGDPQHGEGDAGAGRGWLGRRLGAWVIGGVPFAIAFGWFNARFFGSPLTLGYTAASGPSHGLGFHEDPWGRMYAATDAVGYTSAELLALGHDLLGTPVPVVAVVGVWLLFAPRLSRGVRILAAWALLPVLASALYWHHDLVFGPRMLGEAAPAWCALAVLAVVGLARLVRKRPRAADAIVLAAVLAIAWSPVKGIPDILGRYPPRLGVVPEPPADEPALVFLHEPWADRQGGLLSGMGLRLDSVRALLTRYPPCQIEAGLRGIGAAEAGPHCWREQASDGPFIAALRAGRGVEGLTALLWPNDLPGLPAEGVLWARDLGPDRNRALIARHPDRVPYVLVPPLDEESPWNFLPYEQGIRLIWPPLDAAPPQATAPPD